MLKILMRLMRRDRIAKTVEKAKGEGAFGKEGCKTCVTESSEAV